MLTRRDLVKLGLVGSGAMLLPHDQPLSPVQSSFADDVPASPRTTPFVDQLLVPPLPIAVDPFLDFPQEYAPFVGPNTQFFRVVAEERVVRFTGPGSKDFPQNGTRVWGYRDGSPTSFPNPWPFALGPLFATQYTFEPGEGLMVRQVNNLPANHRGFGFPVTTVHLHGGHHPARSDGFATNIPGTQFLTQPGGHFDHSYPMLDCGFIERAEGASAKTADIGERPSTLWYHDHLIDFTGANVYRGLVGMSLVFDDLDTGDDDPAQDPYALRLPRFPEFDIPLVLQDKRFNRDGSLWFSTFDHDGFIGDKFLVNGQVQPYLPVERRRYRFRVLNGSNARIYRLYLTNALGQSFPMTQIALEGGLLSIPIPNVQSFMVAPAERVEVVIDFGADVFAGQQTLFLENRLEQDDGRRPDGIVSRGTQLMRFNLVGEKVTDDQSRVGKLEDGVTVLRRCEGIRDEDLQNAVVRTFEFGRSSGAWTINDRLAGDMQRPRFESSRGRMEIWRLVNKSGGWWHPIHIHSEFGRILRRNGRMPPLAEQNGIGKKDTFLVKDNETVEVAIQFRDYGGPFMFHCHNLEHEDMAMMARFDVA